MKIKQSLTFKNTIPYLTIQNYKLHIKLNYFGVHIPWFEEKKEEDENEEEELLACGNMLHSWNCHTVPYEEIDFEFRVKKRTSFSFRYSDNFHLFFENQRGKDEYEFLNLPDALVMNLNPNQIWSARFYQVVDSRKSLVYYIFSLSQFISVKPYYLHLAYLLNQKNNRIHRVKLKNSIRKKKLWFYGKGFIFWRKWLRHRILKARRRRRRWLIKKRMKMKALYIAKFFDPTTRFVKKKKKNKDLIKCKEMCLEKLAAYFKKNIESISSESGYPLKFTHLLFLKFCIKQKFYDPGVREIVAEHQLLYDEYERKRELKKEKEKKSPKMRRMLKLISVKFYQLATARKNSFFYLTPLRIVNQSLKRNNTEYFRFLFKVKSRRKKAIKRFPKEKPFIGLNQMNKKDRKTVISGIISENKIRHLRVKFAITHLQFHFPTFRVI